MGLLELTYPLGRILKAIRFTHSTKGSYRLCNNDSLAKGFWLKVAGDEVGATGFKMVCDDDELLNAGNDHSDGSWSAALCPEGSFINGFASKVEADQGWVGDDAAMTAARCYCSDGSSISIYGNGPGEWGSADYCSSSSPGNGVCGFRQRVEGAAVVDPTGLNAVQLLCCSIPTASPTKDPTPAPPSSPPMRPTSSPTPSPTPVPTMNPTKGIQHEHS